MHFRSRIFLFFLLLFSSILTSNATQTDVVGPAGSGQFGSSATVLPNGNLVVVDLEYDLSGPFVSNVGAVHLYDGTTLALISTLTGSTASDQVGSGGVFVLTNGNYVVGTPNWNIPSGAADVGAVTFCNANTGCNGTVSSSNSLIGSTANDQVSTGSSIFVLTNGNYVVRSANWDNGATVDAGAITRGNGTSGTVGAVTIVNSLVGTTASDQVGVTGVTVLNNGNYVVRSSNWDNGAIVSAGAVTWGTGTGGTVGAVTIANSLVGSTTGDQVGSNGVTALTNGNYVVRSANWDNGAIAGAGAVTWGNGTSGTVGAVSIANSLVGSTASDSIGNSGVTALTNGNYVVRSGNWDNGAITNVGAVTWGNGTSGTDGAVSSANSLVGTTSGDNVGGTGVTALTNGNYVVISSSWDNGAINAAGAVTWGNGSSGTVGTVSSANSLVGTTANDNVGTTGVTALTNGNYVVVTSDWNNGAILDAGAVTWGNGTSGTAGALSSANSLVGSTASDLIGNGGVFALTNGNYVVRSSGWDDGAIFNAGAATWGNGASGVVGAVSSANSLVGSTTGDAVSSSGIAVLTNGNYVVTSMFWDNGAIANVGAATWGNGTTGTVGTVSTANSLFGATANDNVGNGGATALTNGNYVARGFSWDNGAIVDAGAVTWGNGTSGTVGVVSSANSLVGSTASDQVGINGTTALTNGNYVVRSNTWDNPVGAVSDARAYTFAGGNGTIGVVSNGTTGGNSVVGTVNAGISTFAFDATRNRIFVGRALSNAVSVLSFATTAISDGDLSNAANWDNGVPNALVSGIIPNLRTMTISSVMNAGQIQIQCGGNLTSGSSTAYIVGSVRRDFCSASGASFTFPIGDPNNYSPLNVTSVNGTGSLTAMVSDTFMPGLSATTSTLSRYWSLVGSGVSANLTFNYTNADVSGTESGYFVFRRPLSNDALVSRHSLSSVNVASNTVTAYNVSSFSDWGVSSQPLAPTAASVSIEGRVIDGAFGIRNAVVTLTDQTGNTRTARTNAFGYYRFDDIESGQTVILSVASKQYSFATQVISVTDNIAEADFVALQE